MSLYKYLKNEGYFFIIYNVSAELVFKPSSSYGTSNIGAYDGIEFKYGGSHSLLYPRQKAMIRTNSLNVKNHGH